MLLAIDLIIPTHWVIWKTVTALKATKNGINQQRKEYMFIHWSGNTGLFCRGPL